MTSRASKTSVWFWASACTAAGGLCWFALSDAIPLASEVTAAAAPQIELPTVEPVKYRTPPLQSFDAITARPLFAVNRRPYQPPPAPVEEEAVAASETVEPPAVQLVGVMLTDFERSALFSGEGSTRWVFEGQAIEGWQVSVIEPGYAVLSRDGLETRLTLRPD